MKKAISKNLKTLTLLSLAIFVGGTFSGCQDEVDQSNRFTFTGELIASHLENNPLKYSHFVDILGKASIGKNAPGNLLKTLSTYGAYTCIAPTNEALEEFVLTEYEKYQASVEAHEASGGESPIIDNGITSPYVGDLSAEKCTEIAKNHIIEEEYRTIDFPSGGKSLPTQTMNIRDVKVSSTKDPVTGETRWSFGEEGIPSVEEDIYTHNGTIHSISGVLNPSQETAAEANKDAGSISTFRNALKKTGLDALLSKHIIDEEYDPNIKPDYRLESAKGVNHEYPGNKIQGYTLLIEPDSILRLSGINDWEDLVKYAEEIYGSEDGYEDVYTHPKNALFKFMAYHIIDRKLKFTDGGGGWMMGKKYINESYTKFEAENHFPTDKNWHDYFETYLPYSEWDFTPEELVEIENGEVPEGCMIKVTKAYADPSFRDDDIVLNYSTEEPTGKMKGHTNIRVIHPDSIKKVLHVKEKLTSDALNASIFLIDKILIYDEDDMREYVIKERMRWDIMSCFPELTTNAVRYNTNVPITCIPVGAGTGNEKQYSKRLRIRNSDDTQFFYFAPARGTLGGFTNYLGDEVLAIKNFDFEYRIPHVPAGTYEIRVGWSMSNVRGIIQFYLDDVICGLPVDMRNDAANKLRIGWFSDYVRDNKDQDTDTKRPEQDILDDEKALRNRGFMKAPASVNVIKKDGENGQAPTLAAMRHSDQALRRILLTNQLLSPSKKGHWIRVKNVTQGGDDTREYNQDYLEIVPKLIYNNPSQPEDRD